LLNVVLVSVVIILIIILAAWRVDCPGWFSNPEALHSAACPEDWVRYRGKCYYFSELEATWTDSQKNCSAHDASLAGIDSQQEMDFLMRYKGSFDHWIGLQREPGQPWKWANGTKFNNLFLVGGEEHCAFLNHNDVGSTGCAETGRWICSKPVQ
uniref:C-type lectin domain-containing protein n=1 Tax=Pelodiscus sinensis TaxID=13735 RepID=K7F924_PELSI